MLCLRGVARCASQSVSRLAMRFDVLLLFKFCNILPHLLHDHGASGNRSKEAVRGEDASIMDDNFN